MEICSKVGLSFFPYLTLKHSFSVFRYQFLGQSERISAGCSYGTRSLALFGCELMVLEDYNSVGVITKAVSRCAPLSLSLLLRLSSLLFVSVLLLAPCCSFFFSFSYLCVSVSLSILVLLRSLSGPFTLFGQKKMSVARPWHDFTDMVLTCTDMHWQGMDIIVIKYDIVTVLYIYLSACTC